MAHTPHRARMAAAAAGLAVATLAMLVATSPAAQAEPQPSQPFTILRAGAPDAIADRYVVVLKEQRRQNTGVVRATATGLARTHSGRIRHVYDSALNGFSVTMTEAQARRLAAHKDVAYVEQAHTVTLADTQTNPPNWGDDRVDQANLPLDRSFTYPADPGQGATVYVLDSGLNANHQDFSGRVRQGVDMVDDDSTPTDCHGHGTHVAGTAVGTTYGIAKRAGLVAVRVLNCQGSGSNDDIIAGINWVRTNAQKPAVVNYSIGCQSRCSSATMDSAVRSLISSGVQWVQAAGNSGDDACYYSPQGVAEAVTVGNTTNADARNSSSNHGSCLDVFAPGTSIVSASYSSNTGSATMTGTSMASPHVAGAAAVYLGQNPNATPAQVRNALVDNGTRNKVTSPGSGSPNVLLYTGFMNGTPSDDFSLAVDPTSGSVAAGSSLTTTVTTAVASGSAVTVALSASGLPSGATSSFNPTSVTAGGSSTLTIATATSTAAGSYTVTVTGRSGTLTHAATYGLAVTGGGTPGNPVVTNPGTRTATVGTPVDIQLAATGGTTPYTWSVTGLPPGLRATGSGRITGTPTTAGTYRVTATVTDAAGHTGSAGFDVVVSAAPSGGVTNGGFESGSTAGWTAGGQTGVVTSPVRSGAYAGRIGNTPGTSSLRQTFTATRGQLSLWTRMGCTAYYGFGTLTVTLTDNSTGQSRDLAFTFCTVQPGWQQVAGTVVSGRSYTLTLTLVDQSFFGGSARAYVDDVSA